MYYIAGKLNFVPDALSRLLSRDDKDGRSDETPVLDNIWFIKEEAYFVRIEA